MSVVLLAVHHAARGEENLDLNIAHAVLIPRSQRTPADVGRVILLHVAGKRIPHQVRAVANILEVVGHSREGRLLAGLADLVPRDMPDGTRGQCLVERDATRLG
jgi:hypothetical protein